MSEINDKLIQQFMDANSNLNEGENHRTLVQTISVGIVVNTDDPLEEGRLMVFCPEFNDSPKKIHQLPWASYCTPFGGSINNGEYTRGSQVGLEKSSGAIHYGFWGIPEQGAHVLIACLNGDIQRRVWLGCLPEHQETHTLFNGRFSWDGGTVDGPFTSTGSPIEPAYTNAGEAFQGKRDSPEWKTRGADYQANSVREDLGEVPNPSKSSYLDNQYPQMAEAEQDKWVKEKVGSHGYDWTGYKSLGAFKSSRVYGMSTPGFHSFSMDDRAFNSRIRLKTTAGHQLLLDDTNERIVISTYGGKASIEMDVNGNIDVYTDKRLSMHSKQDINIESDETVRIKGKKGIHLYSGNTDKQTGLEVTPPDGQIRMHATHDIHMMTEKSLRVLTKEDGLFEYGRDVCTTIAGTYNLQVEEGINTIVNAGDMSTSIKGSWNLNATANISNFAGNNIKQQAINNTEIFSYTGKLDMASYMDLNIKSKGENVAVESVKKSTTISGGNNTAVVTVDTNGATIIGDKKVKIYAGEEVSTVASTNASVAKLKDDPPGCITFPGVVIKLKDSGAEEHDVDGPDADITYKLPAGVTESVKKINEKFAILEEKWDNHMSVVAKQTLLMQSWVTDLFGGGNLVLELPFDPNILPIDIFDFGLPLLELPTLTLPTLCVDLSNIFKIEGLELLPDSLFELNIDMGGWTKDNIMGWVNGLKGQVDNLKGSFGDALSQIAGIQTQITNVIDQITTSVENINVLSINFTNPTGDDSDVIYATYNVTIGQVVAELQTYNDTIVGEGLPAITSVISEFAAHVDNNNVIQANIVSGGLDTTDFSILASAADTLDGYVTLLGGGI